MRIDRLLPATLALFLACVFAGRLAYGQKPVVTLTPSDVLVGSPELIRIDAPGAARVSGEWFGRSFEFFRGSGRADWFALVGVDVEAQVGVSTLRIQVAINNNTIGIDKPVQIFPAKYRTEKIVVEPKFVEPGQEDQAAIAAAVEAKKKAFASSESNPLWSGSFEAPVTAPSSDSFGVRRTYNGKVASIHKGTDFRAPTGTPVLAGNSGVVVLAQLLYYEGNCVMIDHGMGLMSISMHLSQIDVKPGQRVAKGERVGLSGATGRVTGPHLHWAIRWKGSMLDAAKLLRMNLNGVR